MRLSVSHLCVRADLRRLGNAASVLLALTSGATYANAPDNIRWVHGSWVNVREHPNSKAPVTARLVANSKVTLNAQQGDWCEVVAVGTNVRGYLACSLLGSLPLQLSDVGAEYYAGQLNPKSSPPRAFWLAPSVKRLMAAGRYYWSTMLSDRVRAKEEYHYGEAEAQPSFDLSKPPKIVRFPIPEFEAMKDLVKKGLVAAPENRPVILKLEAYTKAIEKSDERMIQVEPGLFLDEGGISLVRLAKPSAIKPSLFKHADEFVSSGASVEEISAQFGIEERLRILSGPKWIHPRHNDPYVAGSWDIGSYEIILSKPIVETVIGRHGLVSALEWLPTSKIDIDADEGCTEGMDLTQRGVKRLDGYPRVTDPLAGFHMSSPLPFKKAVIKKSVKRTSPNVGKDHDRSTLAMVVMHDIDLDGDGIADLAVWEGIPPAEWGNEVAVRIVLANVAGEWYLIESATYSECT